MVVLDRTYVIYKMLIKTFKFFFCLVIMLCSACSSSDNPVDQEQEEDKYFFRYEVTCVSDSAQSIKKLYVITDNGNIITQMPEGKKQSGMQLMVLSQRNAILDCLAMMRMKR